MEINKKLIDSIDIFVEKCDNFDIVYQKVLDIILKRISDNVDILYGLVECYIEIRKYHGIIIKLYNEFEKSVDINNERDMYDLSSYNSIIDNIKNLIQNVDFQYKQFASYYPDLIDNNSVTVLLIINEKETEKDLNLINLLNKVKRDKYQNKYKVMKMKKNKSSVKLNVNKNKITLNPKSVPSLYLLRKNNLLEVPGDNIQNENVMASIIN